MVGGRKREFDKTEALEQAMRVFWQKGYLGASLSDLTEGMGINKPSLYSTFGNKEALFILATEYYIEHHAKQHLRFLHEEKPLQQRLTNYLKSVTDTQFAEAFPKGCYISFCLSESASDCMPEAAKQLIKEVSDYSLVTLKTFFTEDLEAKKLGLDENSEQNALVLITLMHGAAALARAGKSQDDIAPIIEKAVNSIIN